MQKEILNRNVYVKRVNFKIFFVSLLIIALFLSPYLIQYVNTEIFSYLDEFVVVAFVIYYFFNKIKNGITKDEARILLLIFSIVILGITGNIAFSIQTNRFAIAIDIFACFKVFIILLSASEFFYRFKIEEKRKLISVLSFFFNLFTITLFICCIINSFVDSSMRSEPRFGIYSFNFININAGSLSSMFYPIMLVNTLSLIYARSVSRKCFQLLIIAFSLIVWCSTLRTRAFIFSLIYIFLFVIVFIKNKNIKFNPITIFVIVVILFLVGYNQFHYYFVEINSARSYLMKYGIQTMLDHLPFGTGFATFGTDAAWKYYSPLYYQYGFDLIYGLDPFIGGFQSDTYWAAILAQFGIIGTILFIVLIFFFIKFILKRASSDKYLYFVVLFAAINMVVASLATSVFFSPSTVCLCFILPIAFNYGEKKNARN